MDLICRSSKTCPKSCIPCPIKACRSAQVIREVQPHTSNPHRPFRGLLLKSAAFFFIMKTGREGSHSGRSFCTRQSAHFHPTTMELVCGQGRLRLDKYASMPQRRCSYFHRFVWECKFMCVIPVYYINAPGQNENEYSHMHALAHTRLILLKSINPDIVVLPSQHSTVYSVLQMIYHICNMYVFFRYKNSESLMNINVVYRYKKKGLLPF